MNYGSAPADQVVRFTLEGTEMALRLSGLAAKNFALFVYAVLKDQKKTRGKTRLVRMLREPRPFKFFKIPADHVLIKPPIWWHTKTTPNRNAMLAAPDFRLMISDVGVTVASPQSPRATAKTVTAGIFSGRRKRKIPMMTTRPKYRLPNTFLRDRREHTRPQHNAPAIVPTPKAV